MKLGRKESRVGRSQAQTLQFVDLPLNEDVSARFVPWMVGVMLYLALMLSGCGLLLSQSLHRQVEASVPSLTIEVPLIDSPSILLKQELLGLLERVPGVSKAQVVSEEEIQQSFKEFFHEDLGGAPATPLLIDVWAKGSLDAVALTIQENLNKLTENGHILIHKPWAEGILSPVSSIVWIAAGGALVFLVGLLAVVGFAVRTGISIHAPVIEVLDLMGASEGYIVRQFQRQSRMNFLKSLSLVGCLTLVTVAVVQITLESAGLVSFSAILEFLPLYGLWCVFYLSLAAFLVVVTTSLVVKQGLSSLSHG